MADSCRCKRGTVMTVSCSRDKVYVMAVAISHKGFILAK